MNMLLDMWRELLEYAKGLFASNWRAWVDMLHACRRVYRLIQQAEVNTGVHQPVQLGLRKEF